MSLVAELGGDIHLLGDLRQLASFPHGMGKRFFAIDMLAHQHRLAGGMKVGVVRRADDDGINLLVQLIQHHAEILEFPSLVELFKTLARFGFIDVTHGDNVFAVDATDVCRPASADSNASDVQFFIRRGGTRGRRRTEPIAAGKDRGCF